MEKSSTKLTRLKRMATVCALFYADQWNDWERLRIDGKKMKLRLVFSNITLNIELKNFFEAPQISSQESPGNVAAYGVQNTLLFRAAA